MAIQKARFFKRINLMIGYRLEFGVIFLVIDRKNKYMRDRRRNCKITCRTNVYLKNLISDK